MMTNMYRVAVKIDQQRSIVIFVMYSTYHMYAFHNAKQEALASLKKAIGKGVDIGIDDLELPPNPAMGDIAFPCFVLAKKQKANPVEIARELAAKIGPTDLIEKTVATGPYVNFVLNDITFTKAVLGEVAEMGEKYGNGTVGEGVKVLIEGAQPNTHKEFHVGHIRNAVYPVAVQRVLKASGYEVVFAAYIGDIGAHVAKALWGLDKFHKDEEFAKEDRAKKLGEIYTEATTYAEEHEEAKEEIAQVQRHLEAQEEPWHSKWQETREWSMDAFREIFKELNVEPDVWYFESEVEEPGKKLVQKMLTDGIATKSQGATVVDLEAEDLSVFLVLKSDGSSLYATKDLPLAFKKDEKYDADRYLYVVDVRQSFYFQQLFATLKRLGFKKQLTHLSYDMVNLPEGTMSSRKGNIVTYAYLRDHMREYLEGETRARHEDWSDKQVVQTAAVLQHAAMTFMMLRQDPQSIITFDIKEAMSFDGFTGPYILYTIARIMRVQEKASSKGEINIDLLNHPLEQQLIRRLSEYPDVVARAASSYNVAPVAAWAFETAKLFSEYYHQVQIIGDDLDGMATRVGMAQAVAHVLTLAMDLLGIDVLKEM
jgi:arginyl-tRNA synthetase